MTALKSVKGFVQSRYRTASRAWNQYFFADAALNSLALYRIVFFGLVSLEGLFWLPYAVELFSTDGFHIRYQFFSAYISPWESVALCSLLVVTGAMASVGYYAKFSMGASLLIFALLHSVDSINEKAIETVMMVVMVTLIFSPCHRMYSLDTYLGRIQRREKGCIFFQRFLQWEFAQIYFFCGVTKIMVPDWPSGKVLINSLCGRWASEYGVWVSSWIPEWAIKAGGLGTILFEVLVGFMLLGKTYRWLGVMLTMSFHLGIALTLSIGSLGCHFLAVDALIFFNPDRAARFYRWVGATFRRFLLKVRQPFVVFPETAPSQNEVLG